MLETLTPVETAVPLNAPPKNDIIPAMALDQVTALWRAYLETRRRVLQTELNEVLRQLGCPQKHCPHCGEPLK